jgi:hypothetical protein
MRLKPVTVVAIVLVLVLVVAGCGGGKKSAASATTAAGSTTTSAASTTVAAPSFASAKSCKQLAALGAKMSQALQASSGNGLNSLDDEANVFKALASAAPSEIRGDFETFAEAFSGYAKALSSAKIKPGTTPTAAQIAALTAAAKSFSTPKLQAAEQHLSAWGQKNCGVGSTTTG